MSQLSTDGCLKYPHNTYHQFILSYSVARIHIAFGILDLIRHSSEAYEYVVQYKYILRIPSRNQHNKDTKGNII